MYKFECQIFHIKRVNLTLVTDELCMELFNLLHNWIRTFCKASTVSMNEGEYKDLCESNNVRVSVCDCVYTVLVRVGVSLRVLLTKSSLRRSSCFSPRYRIKARIAASLFFSIEDGSSWGWKSVTTCIRDTKPVTQTHTHTCTHPHTHTLLLATVGKGSI